MDHPLTKPTPRLFKHVKGKLYKFGRVARHSETLEEYVVYEALYQNDLGRDWIRPKSMFFETVTYNSLPQPRFKEIQMELMSTSASTDLPHFFKMIQPILSEHFAEVSFADLDQRLGTAKHWLLQVGLIDGTTCGFKLGYELADNLFYSWLGGVSTDYSGLGVASRLMDEQFQWCKHRGYGKIQTKTLNKWKRMLVLNLKNGFDITATYTNAKGELKLVLERIL